MKRVEQCRVKRGMHSERCCVPKLELRRCLAFTHCPKEASDFYYHGTASNHSSGRVGGDAGRSQLLNATTLTAVTASKGDADTHPGIKSQCAAFQEVSCFGNPRIMNVEGSNNSKTQQQRSDKAKQKEMVFLEHEKAKRRLTNNRLKHRECLDVTDRLQRCLHNHGVQSQ